MSLVEALRLRSEAGSFEPKETALNKTETQVSNLDSVREAVETTIAFGTGRVNQFLKNADGGVAGLVEAIYDADKRRVRMRSRFLIEGEEVDLDDGMTEWVTSVVDQDLLHLERPSESPEWLTVTAPWPSASPLVVLHWLRGIKAISSEQPSLTSPGGLVARVILSASSAVSAAEPADAPGVQSSFDEVQLGAATSLDAEVLITETRVIEKVSLVLAGEEGDLALETEFSDLGTRVDILIPETAAPLSVEEFVRVVVADEPGTI